MAVFGPNILFFGKGAKKSLPGPTVGLFLSLTAVACYAFEPFRHSRVGWKKGVLKNKFAIIGTKYCVDKHLSIIPFDCRSFVLVALYSISSHIDQVRLVSSSIVRDITSHCLNPKKSQE